MAVILVQNEKTGSGEFDHYQDETGKKYQLTLFLIVVILNHLIPKFPYSLHSYAV